MVSTGKVLIPVKIGGKCSSKMPHSVCYLEWRMIGHTYFADPLLQCDLEVKSSQLLQLCSSALPSPMSPKIKSVGQWSNGDDKDIDAYHRNQNWFLNSVKFILATNSKIQLVGGAIGL